MEINLILKIKKLIFEIINVLIFFDLTNNEKDIIYVTRL